MSRRHFLSDNASGAHPSVIEALARVNEGHVEAYGHDPYTARAEALLRQHFGQDARPFLVFTGTGSNVLAVTSMLASYQAAIASDCAHLHWDECGALEAHAGCKLLLATSRRGKIDPDALRPHLEVEEMVHRARPRVLSVSQATEWGTVYTVDEIRALVALCRKHDLLLHMDGARLTNAAVSLGLDLKAATTDLGVDVVSFGGTKNGLLAAEAVVFVSDRAGRDFGYVRKQGLHLASKMRFVAAQFIAFFEEDLWRRMAAHANRMARRLAEAVEGVSSIEIASPVDVNMVFARCPAAWIAPLQEHTRFHVWDPSGPIVRWVTSFDTTEEDIDGFAKRLRALEEGGS
jgi:threonine aldolase